MVSFAGGISAKARSFCRTFYSCIEQRVNIHRAKRALGSIQSLVFCDISGTTKTTRTSVSSLHAFANVNQELIKRLEADQTGPRVLNINDDIHDNDHDGRET